MSWWTYSSRATDTPPLPFVPFRGAFCIPDALPGIPYGDGKRIWTPAFGAYAGTPWQQRMIDAVKARRHDWFEYQVSGSPYHGDYPDMDLNIDRIVADLTMLKRAGLRSIVAFRDDVGPDLSYLKDMAKRTQHLVNCVMGIYEMNGVFNDDIPTILSVLKQQGELYPNAINAFHSTTQDNGGHGFGEADFWKAAHDECGVTCYFLQQSAWNHTLDSTADRASDFIERLQHGPNQYLNWPRLEKGVVLFEETTTATYHLGMAEGQAIATMDTLFARCRVRPMGFMDGGSIAL